MNSLLARDINVSYGQRQVLRDVRFDALEPGKLAVLIGPNASGKSTLFKTISGLLKPSSGLIRLGDIDLGKLPVKQRLSHVCFMPQSFSANASLTVFDVVMMAHKQVKGWRVNSDDMQSVGQACYDAGIGDLSEAYISELSGGQAQLVSVTQALIRRADVYLFDEPTSALDLRHQLEVLERIKQAIKKRSVVGIVALHDLNLAARFADTILVMQQGYIVLQGTPDTVIPAANLADTYGVSIEVSTGPRRELSVHAYPV